MPDSTANVFRMKPRGSPSKKTIDVAALLTKTQCAPTVLITAKLQKAIDARARVLAEEAYALCRVHLQRRVAYKCEFGRPRQVDFADAYAVINQGSLNDALTAQWVQEMEHVASYSRTALRVAAEFDQKMRDTLHGF